MQYASCSKVITTCLLHVSYLLPACFLLVYCLFSACSQLVYNQLTACFQPSPPAHELFFACLLYSRNYCLATDLSTVCNTILFLLKSHDCVFPACLLLGSFMFSACLPPACCIFSACLLYSGDYCLATDLGTVCNALHNTSCSKVRIA